MLSDKLAAAEKESGRRLRTLTHTVGLTIVVALVGLWVVESISKPDLNQPEELSAITSQVAAPVHIGEQVAAGPTEFEAALKVFQSETRPRLESANPQQWAAQAYSRILGLADSALASYSGGKFGEALEYLKQAESEVGDLLNEWEQRYMESFSAANRNFEDNDADRAMLNIREALNFKPNEPSALILRDRIKVLPEVAKLLEEAEISRVENNSGNEVRLLRQVLSLDPGLARVQARINELKTSMAEAEFAGTISRGLEAARQGRVAEARHALDVAKAMEPGRLEIGILEQRIVPLEKAADLGRRLQKGNSAENNDDWDSALEIYQAAQAKHPNNRELAQKATHAAEIISVRHDVDDFVARSHRMSTPSILQHAREALAHAKKLGDDSKSLAGQADKLENLIDQYSSPVSVVFNSDNQTDIAIRGVGIIGKTMSRTINLTPGIYDVEGKRQGFRSKLVEVVVAHSTGPVSVNIICDERI